MTTSSVALAGVAAATVATLGVVGYQTLHETKELLAHQPVEAAARAGRGRRKPRVFTALAAPAAAVRELFTTAGQADDDNNDNNNFTLWSQTLAYSCFELRPSVMLASFADWLQQQLKRKTHKKFTLITRVSFVRFRFAPGLTPQPLFLCTTTPAATANKTSLVVFPTRSAARVSVTLTTRTRKARPTNTTMPTTQLVLDAHPVPPDSFTILEDVFNPQREARVELACEEAFLVFVEELDPTSRRFLELVTGGELGRGIGQQDSECDHSDHRQDQKHSE